MKNKVDKFDELLKVTLMEDAILNPDLVDTTRKNLHGGDTMLMNFSKKKPLAFAAAIMIGFILTGVTAFATWNLLTPSEVASEFDDDALALIFNSEDALNINENVTSAGYIFTLLSIVAGTDFDIPIFDDAKVRTDRMYAVVAIRKVDGTSMVESDSTFFSSPYVRGFAPRQLNITSLGSAGGGYQESIVNGVLYRLIDMQNVESFAAHGVYLGISQGNFSFEAFNFDHESGVITLNSEFDGPSVLFELSLDITLANEERVQEILAKTSRTDDDKIADVDEHEAGIFFEVSTEADDHITSLTTNQEMNNKLMNYDELAEFLETRIQMHIANGEPEAVISGARRDKAEDLRRMRVYNIEFANVWYDDDFDAIAIQLTVPD